jgi:hypothetical protein
MLVSSMLLIFVPVRSVAAEPVRVYVDPSLVANPVVLFNVSVKTDNVENLAGVQFTLVWNPLLLKAINMTEVMFHETTPQSEWDNIFILDHDVDSISGFASYAYHHRNITRALDMGYLPISGNYTIATILFQVVGVGNCSLQLTKIILATPDANSIPYDKIDGFFSNSVPPPSLPPSPPDSAQVLIYVNPRRIRNESAAVNDTFDVAVKLDSISNHSGLISVRFGLEWNSTVLDCIGVNEVMFHEILPESEWQDIDWSFSIDNVSGTMEGTGTFQNIPASKYAELAIFGNHTLATVTFRIKSVGRCVLHLFDCNPVEYNPGRPNQMLYATIDGYFANQLSGDLNGDNRVDLFDAIGFAGCFGMFPGYPRWNEEADMNGDGKVDICDAIALCACFGHAR